MTRDEPEPKRCPQCDKPSLNEKVITGDDKINHSWNICANQHLWEVRWVSSEEAA